MIQVSKRLEDLVGRAERDFVPLSESETTEPAIAGGWSRKQILGHLIDSASNNHQRFVRALLADELRWPSYDQTGCVRVQRYQDVLAGVPDAKRSTPCLIGDNPVLTLEELAVDYLKHMQHHLEQIRGEG